MANINMEIIKLKGFAEMVKGEYLRYLISHGINPTNNDGNILVQNMNEISEIGKNVFKCRTEDEIHECRSRIEGFRELLK